MQFNSLFMNKSRSKPLRLVHDNPGANIATWSKSVVLLPPWALILLAPLGAICRGANLPYSEPLGLIAAFSFGVVWFLRDLMLKRILITDTQISCGFSEVMLSDLKAIRLEKNRYNLPVKLVFLGAEDKRRMTLSATRLTDEALETLLDTIQRRAPQARIDPAIDEVLQYRRRKVSQEIRDLGSSVSIAHHANRSWEGLMSEFRRAAGHWSRNLGPVGVFLLCIPIWVTVDLASFCVMRDYSRYNENRQLYDSLISFVGWISTSQFQVLEAVGRYFVIWAKHPLLLFCGVTFSLLALVGISKSILGANRISLDKNELSLDRWMALAAVNFGAIEWTNVSNVGLKADEIKPTICLFGKDGRNLLIVLDAIDGTDRPRLLKAIRRFAPDCCIDSAVLELLEPGNKKSYTQLWLQSLTAAPQRKKLEPLKPGDLIHSGRYEVVRRLGVGGQGSAYLCVDLSNIESGAAPQVVLKEVVVPVFVDQAVREQTIDKFVQEAELLEKLNFDGSDVVKLLDYFVDDHRAYLVLEHVDGTSLRELVKSTGPMAAAQVEELAHNMCSILETLHQNEVIHRDFTPDNLILRKDGKLTLIDFNVAQSSDAGITDTIVGKHAYVPPEQFRGRPSKQSDLYALGATLYFLLKGHDPEPLSRSSLTDSLEAASDPLDSLGSSNRLSLLDKLISECTAIELSDRLKNVECAIAILDSERNETNDVEPEASVVDPDGERIVVRDHERARG